MSFISFDNQKRMAEYFRRKDIHNQNPNVEFPLPIEYRKEDPWSRPVTIND
jgi:hypothetical protein